MIMAVLAISSDFEEALKRFLCIDDEECIWQESPAELVMEGSYNVMKVIHRAEVVRIFVVISQFKSPCFKLLN